MTIKVHQPHDSFAKRMLADIEVAKALIQSHLSTEITRRIDWESLQLTNKSFVNENLEQFHSDVIHQCTIDNKQAYVYSLIEHQSTPDKWLVLRILGYNIELMKQHLSEGNEQLPIIINICIYAGEQSPYPYSADIFDYFELPALAREKMFKPIKLIDLTIPEEEELLKDETGGLIKLLLKQGVKHDHLNWIKKNSEVMIKIVESTFGISCIIYILGTDSVSDPNDLLDAMIQLPPKQKDKIMTAALKLQQEGEIKGKMEVAKSMLQEGLNISLIEKITGLSQEELKKL